MLNDYTLSKRSQILGAFKRTFGFTGSEQKETAQAL